MCGEAKKIKIFIYRTADVNPVDVGRVTVA